MVFQRQAWQNVAEIRQSTSFPFKLANGWHRHKSPCVLLLILSNRKAGRPKVGKGLSQWLGQEAGKREKERKEKGEERKRKDKASLHLSPPSFVKIALSRNNLSRFPPSRSFFSLSFFAHVFDSTFISRF